MAFSLRKCVSITFLGDQDAVETITHIDKPMTRKQKSILNSKSGSTRSSRKSTAKKSVNYADSDSDDNLDSEDEVFRPSDALAEHKDNVEGSNIYGFRTPKKSGAMVTKASASRTPKSSTQTPKSKTEARTLTSTRKSKKSDMDDEISTPKRPKRQRKIEATTPYRLRKRNEDKSDEMSSSDSDEGSDEWEVEAPETPSGRKSASFRQEQTMSNRVEDYFDLHADPKVMTSDRTLARLEQPKMSADELSNLLKSLPTRYEKNCKELYLEYRGLFSRWMFELCNGFNLLFYGVGSKRRLIEDFRKTMLSDFSHLVVNGYFPSLTIKNVLNSITEDILDHNGSFRGLADQVEFIKKHYTLGDYEDFYLLIHNIDGEMLRADKAQAVLSSLATIRGFHLVASIDHINATLLWDTTKSSHFKWLWNDVTTYENYTEETANENSLLVQQTGGLALSALTHVMRSLTPNAKEIFLLLAKYQLDNVDNQPYTGMLFQDLYQKCRERFLVNSDLTLRAQLTEFVDHKLIKIKKGIDGEQCVIPLDAGTLKEFTQQDDI